MRKKIIGIFVCMLLIVTTVLSVAGTTKIDKINEDEQYYTINK